MTHYAEGARKTPGRMGHALLVGGEAVLALLVVIVMLSAAAAVAIVAGPIVLGLALLVLVPLVLRGLFS